MLQGSWTLLVLSFFFLLLTAPPTLAQFTTPTSSSASSLNTASATRAVTPVSDATDVPVTLNDSSIARTHVSTSGAYFNFTLPASTFESDRVADAWLSLSLCSGPAVEPYNVSNETQLQLLGKTAEEARHSTLVGIYVSDDDTIQRPGPENAAVLSSKWKGFAQGGWVSLELEIRQQTDEADQTICIGVWPPTDRRDTQGTYELQLVISTRAKMESVDYTRRPRLDDTDSNRALITSFNYTAPAPNISAIILPTFGQNSLPSASYFNSSFCAISDAWANMQDSMQAVSIQSSETKRMTLHNDVDDSRMQFEFAGLDSNTNYTAWIVETQRVSDEITYTLFPAIKMRTKANNNCRLVYDVPFCPQVAYSIPIAPEISTDDALQTISRTVEPNYANFSTMIDTFPCGDPYFGMYSYVADCPSCKRAYQDWLCAVSMPRCTNPVSDHESRASQNGRDLTGAPTMENVDLLPYISNRNSSNPSRRDYITTEDYGEILPCIYNCYFVERSCPPLVGWACPVWDITAQRDYGTFADSGDEGIGAGENGGAGEDGLRWGGSSRYIATDGFGNTYCNSLGVEYLLRETNAATAITKGAGVLVATLVGAMLWV